MFSVCRIIPRKAISAASVEPRSGLRPATFPRSIRKPSRPRSKSFPPVRPSPAATISSKSSGKAEWGRVYRAIDKKLNEEVALKLIRPEIARDERTLERFQNELKIARKISHRHVGRMYELMEDTGRPFRHRG